MQELHCGARDLDCEAGQRVLGVLQTQVWGQGAGLSLQYLIKNAGMAQVSSACHLQNATCLSPPCTLLAICVSFYLRNVASCKLQAAL